MGGTIQLVVRKKDGEITSFPVWTNSMSIKLLKNPEFLAGDFTAFNEFVNYHHQLMDDYAENRLTKHFKDSGAPDYGSHPFGGLYPMSYGIVVFDFKAMKIFEMQEYTEANAILTFFEHTVGQSDFKLVNTGLSYNEEIIKKLFEGGHVKSVRTDYYSRIDHDVSHIKSLDEFYIFLGHNFDKFDDVRINSRTGNQHFSLDLFFDKKGFETIVYKGRQQETVEKFLMDIQSVGFELSANDQEQWKSYIRTYED